MSHREQTLEQQLDQLYAEAEEASGRSLGYSCNLQFDYTPRYRFLRFHVNSIGDPLAGSSDQMNSRAMERKVLQFFMELLHLPWPPAWGTTSRWRSACW